VGRKFEDYVKLDPQYLRPTEVDLLIGDATKAKKALNWKPRVTFKDLVRIMVTADLEMEGVDVRKFGLEPNPEGARP
jgi:GDPmannose 4,6-dehydratase